MKYRDDIEQDLNKGEIPRRIIPILPNFDELKEPLDDSQDIEENEDQDLTQG